MRNPEIGVYFPLRTEYADLRSLGVTYAVRPILKEPTGPNDTGFVTDPVIEKPADSTYSEIYGNDEMGGAPDRVLPTNPYRTYNAGDFMTLSNGAYGFNANYIPRKYGRGMQNYMGLVLSELGVLPILRGIITAVITRLLWGQEWTVCIWCVGHHPVWWIRLQLAIYRLMGIKRAFLWRYDTAGDKIRAVLR